MRTLVVALFTLSVAGCDQTEMLPLLDSDGALAGTFDPASGELSIPTGDDAVRDASGEEVALLDGGAVVDWVLAPGDVLELVATDGTSELLEVGDADLVDELSDEEAASRYGACSPRPIH